MTDITKSALQSLREIDDSKAPTRTLTRAESRALLGHVAMLTDCVVMAAALWFDEITDSSERDYASEVLFETAEQLKADNPRLQGAVR